MKVRDIYNIALDILGYGFNGENLGDYPLPENPLSLCNRVFVDLGLNAVESFEGTIDISEDIAEAVCYGIAMFICSFLGDALRQPVYTKIYNSKRGKILSKIENVKDVMVYREG